MEPEGDFRRVCDVDPALFKNLFHVGVRFPLNSINTDISVEEKYSGIPIEAEHPVVAKRIIFCPRTREIGVLDGANAEDAG